MKYLFIAVLFLISLSSYAQKSETIITLDKIIEHAESASLYRNNVDWTSLKKEMHSLAKDADSISQLKPALDFMLKELNDGHGRVFYNNKYLSYYSGYKTEHQINIDSEIYNEIQTGQVYKFKTEILNDDTGYIRIVGLLMGDNQKMSEDIQNAVCDILNKGAKNWIVDLRYNGGGNMFPMIEGITNIIGDGIVGGTKGLTDQENAVWKIEDGDFYYDEQNVAIENKCPISKNPHVAVLTSNYTASSGEVLAVIFKHRDNTKFFGEKTMGKVTVTDYKQIDSLTIMSISVSYYKDRKGNVYDKFIDVDEEIEFNPKSEMASDKGINRAIQWLSGRK